jgi:selenocysteine lyase/cysteine desulfurase
MDAAGLRAHFPVLERVAYLNSGTDGPVAAVAARAALDALDAQLTRGRFVEHFEARLALQGEMRVAYARLVGAAEEEIALTTSTSDGIGRVLAGFALGRGDEVLTSDQEHPGVLGPLLHARARGATVRAVPLHNVADAVGPRTALVAVSHVSWVGGEVAPAALADVDVPVVLDGAQGAGAVPVDVGALGCAAYAASGQKWLCGADGTGFLWIDPVFAERVQAISPSYVCFADAARGLESELKATAARYDTPSLSRESLAHSAGAFRLLEEVGWAEVSARAVGQAAALAAELAERGWEVAPRGDTTLVSWADPEAEATRDRLAAAGVVVRNLPGRGLVRASVGAWNDAGDLERLLSALEG